MLSKLFAGLVVLALIQSSCDHEIQQPSSSTSTVSPAEQNGSSSNSPSETTEPQVSIEPDCSSQVPQSFQPTSANNSAISFEISQNVFACAKTVGIAPTNNLAAITTLANLQLDGPLLLVYSLSDNRLINELNRLDPQEIFVSGFAEQSAKTVLNKFNYEMVEVVSQASFSATQHDRIWITRNSNLPLTVLTNQIGIATIEAPGDLRALPDAQRELLASANVVELLADVDEDARWQLEVVRNAEELPGGGLLLFDPQNPRRLVALYGHPQTSRLGVLGEQNATQALERAATIAQGYDADGSNVLLTFEIIATVAAAQAGSDGDYSNETRLDVIRPWIETAAENGVYVVLDLQPGRSTFLSQAKIYEEFLRLPNVGLAIDPEWRLKPNQRHLRQIGTVDAAEINEVIDWLAAIVREEALPQKLLVLHQFRFSMITNRASVKTPTELAVLVHMDGQGRLATKYATWNALTGEADAHQFYWGWKNFYDEDSPVATPEQVLALEPSPLFVSFQ